jgi:hypothetical protein
MNQDFREYQEREQTKLFNKYGVFFAFSNEQFKEGVDKVGASPENKVVSLGAGMYCLSKNKEELLKGMKAITKNKVAKDIKDNGIDNIIVRELYNYETFISYNFDDVKEALKPYNVSDEQISKAFRKEIPTFEAHN